MVPCVRTRSELDTERFSSAQNGIADGNAGCLLVHLDRRLIRVDTDDLCRA